MVKVKKYKDKYYGEFIIDLINKDEFKQQFDYIHGKFDDYLNEKNYSSIKSTVGIIKNLTYFTSKKGNKCLRMDVWNGSEDVEVMSCNSYYGSIPKDLMSSDMVRFKFSKAPFANVKVVE